MCPLSHLFWAHFPFIKIIVELRLQNPIGNSSYTRPLGIIGYCGPFPLLSSSPFCNLSGCYFIFTVSLLFQASQWILFLAPSLASNLQVSLLKDINYTFQTTLNNYVYHCVFAKLLIVVPFDIKSVPFVTFAIKDNTRTIGEM